MATVVDIAKALELDLGRLVKKPLPKPREGQTTWRPLETEMEFFEVKSGRKRRKIH